MATEIKQQENPKPQEKTRTGRSGRMLTLLLVMAVVLLMAVLSTMEEGNQFAALRRWLMYGSSSETGGLYTYAADSDNQYGVLGNKLLLVTPNTIRLLGDDGNAAYELSISMARPKLSVGGSRAVVCDVGGDTLYVLDSTGIVETQTLDRGLCYFTARLNASDDLVVISQKNGYKASAAVYSKEGKLRFHFDSHDSYISDAVVTKDGRQLVMVALGEVDGAFTSTLVTYEIATAQLVGESAVRDGLVMELAVSGERLLSLCDKRLCITTLTGETLLERTFGNLYLQDYALQGENFCALLLGRYQAGNICQLTTYDLQGQELASLEIGEEVLDLSASADHLAVLYSSSLVIYTRDLVEYARLDSTGYAGQVRMLPDGTALVISGASAWRFCP